MTAHFWKEQDSHTSRKEHLSIKFNRNIYTIHKKIIVFIAIGNNSTSFFYLESIISSHGVLLVILMKESEPIFHRNPQFNVNYPLDDACFILDYYGRNN